jgi:hypothetical protein
MDEPRQLDGDPCRKAYRNRLLGNGKVDRLHNPGTPLGRSCFGRESHNGLERSKSAIGRPWEKYPGFLFKLLPRYLSSFVLQKGWGSARAPFYQAHRTTSAALQLAVDHAFTRSYARRFRPADLPETTTCPCGAHTRTPSYLIWECPRLLQHRINVGIHTHNRTLTLEKLHSSIKHVHQLLTFISEGKVAFRPPDFDITIPIPPDPD